MAIKGWVAAHTGMPSIYATAAGPVTAGGRLLHVVASGRARPVSDPLAPIGVPVAYTQGSASVTLTRRSLGAHLVTDESGHTVARVTWVGSDDTEHTQPVSIFDTGVVQVERWRAGVTPDRFTLECLTDGADTMALRALVRSHAHLVVLHDPLVCQVPGCDVPPVRRVVVTRATESRTGRVDVARRAWSLSCEVREPMQSVETASGVVTWGEWDALDHHWEHRTYLDLCRLIAGMPQ